MKAGHASQYRVNVNAPQVHKKYNLKSKTQFLRIKLTNLDIIKTKTLQKENQVKKSVRSVVSRIQAYLQLYVNTDGFVVAKVGIGTMFL